MSILHKLYRGEQNFDFVGKRRRAFMFSLALIAISLLSLAIFQLNFGVDFIGGTIVESPNPAAASLEDVRSAVGSVGQEGARVQITGEGTGIRVQTGALDGAGQDQLVSAIAAVAGATVDETNVNAVGPSFGAEITRRAIEALIIFLIVVTMFISWRFEWKMAMGALAALFHDLIITAGIYSVTRFEVTPATVIAILTILGYSLYDTVVVFDKVNENVEEYGDRNTFTDIANLSLNQVMMRSVNTSITTLLPVGSLLFVGSFLLGAATLREFALALFIGIAIGTYSSIFVAANLLTVWKERESDWQVRRRRAERRGTADGAADQPLVTAGGAKARPPKQRRRR